MARKSELSKSLSFTRVHLPCSKPSCPEHAITRDVDDAMLCRRHYEELCDAKDRAELKRLDLVTNEEKMLYCRKMVYELTNHFTAEPNTDWAKRIIKRMEDGENISRLQERMAKQALGIDHA